jgi:radical SAM superfamily enzyme YgiQ (UPF0313 family)
MPDSPSKILLINMNLCDAPYPVFPLGLAYVDSALRRAGHQTRWVDWQMGRPDAAETLAEFQPDFIGISLRNIDDVLIKKRRTFFDDLAGLCAEIKRSSSSPIIVGGSGFSIFPEELLALSGADFGIHGEGENSIVELIAALKNEAGHSGIAGLVFREGSRIVVNPLDDGVRADRMAIPERRGNLVEFYLKKSALLNIQTQRGCSFRCCYCTYPLIEGARVRRRAPEAVAEEFDVVRRAGAKYVFIVDAVFNSSAEHVAGVCEAIIRKGVKIKWGCFLHPKNLTADLMRVMAHAGLAHVEFGTDSLCDRVLEAYGKRFTFEDVYESSRLARREKIDFCHFLISGGPGETRETLKIGFKNSRRLENAAILAVVGMRVYPRTRLYERALAEGSGLRGDDLLEPRYYLSPDLTEDEVFGHLREFSRSSSAWIIGDPPPVYLEMNRRLREKGIVRPLWSNFAAMQRMAGRG